MNLKCYSGIRITITNGNHFASLVKAKRSIITSDNIPLQVDSVNVSHIT